MIGTEAYLVNGESVCREQYIEAKAKSVAWDTVARAIKRIDENAGDDKAFRLMVLAKFCPDTFDI